MFEQWEYPGITIKVWDMNKLAAKARVNCMGFTYSLYGKQVGEMFTRLGMLLGKPVLIHSREGL